MNEDIEFAQLDATSAPAPTPAPRELVDLRRLSDVPVDLSVEIGRTRMTVGETLELRPGSIVVLNRTAGEPVDLLVNGTTIARGEVVVIDEEFGLRLTEVVGEQAPAAAPADATGSFAADSTHAGDAFASEQHDSVVAPGA
jgi:flagellar motor switch protein FliN/FliY